MPAANNIMLVMSGDEWGSDLPSGYKAVTTAGTRVQITATSTPCAGVLVQALTTNTNPLTVGTSTVVGLAGPTHIGINLSPGDSVFIPVRDLNLLWLDVITNGEAAYYTCIR